MDDPVGLEAFTFCVGCAYFAAAYWTRKRFVDWGHEKRDVLDRLDDV